MSPGKAAAQLGHAFKLSTYITLKTNPELFESYLSGSIGTNICLVAPTEEYLLEIKEQIFHFPHILVQDSGHVHPPHFDGSPIITCLGLGPISRRYLPRSSV